jgi:hypothetical protein
MTHEWPYYTLRRGRLYRDGEKREAFPTAPEFRTTMQAEQWLKDNNLRGDIRENSKR